MKGILISAPGTGAGKTTVAAALMAALRKRGLVVQPFKCGPDFIDPGHHTLICRRPSHNIDTWMLPAEVNGNIFSSACRDADFAVVEGMMGLFDGVGGGSDQGSSAEIARMFDLPVLLVVDASLAARSVAALVHGFRTFDPRLRVAGVILNRASCAGHAEMLLEALRSGAPDLWVGWLPHHDVLGLQERYLGLQTAAERAWTPEATDLAADLLEKHCPLDSLLERCNFTLPRYSERSARAAAPPVRVGVARDRAFCFYYEAALDELRRRGATIVEFSPLTCGRLPDDLDALYFGGGYPELYAEQLSSQKLLISDLRAFSQAGKPIYGECGGLIFLGRGLKASDGTAWPMAGLLPLSVEMTDRLVHFGYAEMEFVADGFAAKGTRLRGHSFHCSRIVDAAGACTTAVIRYTLSRTAEREGYAMGSVFASYIHLHFAADPSVAQRFLEMARHAREKCRVAG
jgi:cobyrinic acid a,c-diamide synthase